MGWDPGWILWGGMACLLALAAPRWGKGVAGRA